ncbi:MAG: threonine--tRNA ligase [Elusimicrobiaceae bacterium]|nr:threonine--tRNA ligase [Elusimicrobiaceae bacterium]
MSLQTAQDNFIETMRHSAAHVLAQAVTELFPGTKLGIGPAIENGFYYDFDSEHKFTPEDLPAIEAKMKEIVKAGQPFVCSLHSKAEAITFFQGRGEKYKVELIENLPGDTASYYENGGFTDLCRGPHVPDTGRIKHFKLTHVAGAYWRGDEKRPMLQRIYGLAFKTKDELDAHILRQEEAARRDHRKIGREMDLFSVHESVGAGLVHWHPKGARMRIIVEDFWRAEHAKAGYEFLFTPHIGRAALWETSGHLGFYKDNMYAPMDIDGEEYFAKPMNCPFHIQVYKTHKRSYRELPLRWAELGTVYRYEKAGVLHGLMRVRGFTQDDAHIFCTPEQMEKEVARTLGFCLHILRAFGFSDIAAYLATMPADAVGEPERWAKATESLKAALESERVPYELDEGGGAFYGPKIDLKVKDAIGRQWQLGTIQFDFNMSERFELSYVGSDGHDHRPYMIHRALLGSLERFFGILIEHYAGWFPLWLAPVQAKVLTLTSEQDGCAAALADRFRQAGIRVELDDRNEKLGLKIREAHLKKVPYLLIIGPKEAGENTVTVRVRSGKNIPGLRPEDVLSVFLKETAGHSGENLYS